jgi:Zn-dependent protease
MSIQFVIALYEFVILLFSLSFHQCAQGWMAARLGDQTARMQGQITMNPLRHIDPFGTVLFPLLMAFGPLIGFGGGLVFGWAKPTPIITRNFKKIRRDETLTVLAGPFANLILVLAAFLVLAILIKVVPGGTDAVIAILINRLDGAQSTPQAIALLGFLTIQVNLALIFFNLLPVPPLDASHLLRNLLPYNSLQTYDNIARFAFILIFILGRFVVNFFMGPANFLFFHALSLFLPSQG